MADRGREHPDAVGMTVYYIAAVIQVRMSKTASVGFFIRPKVIFYVLMADTLIVWSPGLVLESVVGYSNGYTVVFCNETSEKIIHQFCAHGSTISRSGL